MPVVLTTIDDASLFEQDLIAPTLDSFDLDMDIAKITLTFSEAVDKSKFAIGEFALQNAASGATSSVTLDEVESVISGDGTTITVTLTNAVMNEIKTEEGLATNGDGSGEGPAGDDSDTFLVMTADGVEESQ